MKKHLIYLILIMNLVVQVYQSACSMALPEKKIYFKGNIIDTIQFRNDLKYFNELNKGNSEMLLFEAQNLLQQSKAINLDWGLFISNLEISFAYLKLGVLDSALYYANITMKIADADGDPEWIANAQKRLGSCYEASSNYEQAMVHFIECEKIARAHKLRELIIDIIHAKGTIYRKMKEYDKALELFNSVSKEFPDSLSSFDQFRIANNIASVYYNQEQYEKALKYFMQAKGYAEDTGDSIHIALINQNLGNILYVQKKFNDAEKYIMDAIQYYEEANDKAPLGILIQTLGNILSSKNSFPRAERAYRRSLELAKQMNNIRLQIANYYNLSLNFKRWREKEPSRYDLFEKENSCLQIVVNLKDSLAKIESSVKILEVEKKYETEKKNNQIALLEKETEVQQNRQMFMFIGMVVLVVLIGVLVVAFQYVRKTNNTLLTKNQRIELQKQQIQDQNKQLGIAINTQNKLFSIIAHDLRSPLASISNIGILLKMAFDNNDFETSRELVSKLSQRNNQILQLTDNLLNWAQSQTGKIKFNIGKCNLSILVKESASLFEESLVQKNIKLNLEINDIEVLADSLSIKTVFRNLINNAVKFTNKGGQISISNFRNENQAVVKISDTGIGIPEYMQKMIFEISDRKQQLGTEGEKSSGLGLVVCKEFVEHNDGQIWFESTEGKGTDFYVALPLYSDQILRACLKFVQQ